MDRMAFPVLPRAHLFVVDDASLLHGVRPKDMTQAIDQTIEDNKVMSEGGVEVSIKYIQRDINDIKNKLDDTYVTKDEFNPVRNIVYGMVGLILIAVMAALIALVVIK